MGVETLGTNAAKELNAILPGGIPNYAAQARVAIYISPDTPVTTANVMLAPYTMYVQVTSFVGSIPNGLEIWLPCDSAFNYSATVPTQWVSVFALSPLPIVVQDTLMWLLEGNNYMSVYYQIPHGRLIDRDVVSQSDGLLYYATDAGSLWIVDRRSSASAPDYPWVQVMGSGGSAPQVNADWAATSGVAEILNKPAILTNGGLPNVFIATISVNATSGAVTITTTGNVVPTNYAVYTLAGTLIPGTRSGLVYTPTTATNITGGNWVARVS